MFITIILLLIAGYDVFALFIGGTDATISRILLHDSAMVPAIPFGIGFLFGHVLWPQKLEVKK